MGSTSIYNLPYQELTDAPDGAALGQNLAEAVETELDRIDTIVGVAPRGWVAGLVATSGATTSGSTELVVDYLNFIAIEGRYELRWSARLQGTNGSDAFRVRYRWEATAAALSTGGTQWHVADINGLTSAHNEVYTKTLAGGVLTPGTQYAIGVTLQRASGTGTLTANGSATTERILDLYHVGS